MQHPRILGRGHIGRGRTNIAPVFARSDQYLSITNYEKVLNSKSEPKKFSRLCSFKKACMVPYKSFSTLWYSISAIQVSWQCMYCISLESTVCETWSRLFTSGDPVEKPPLAWDLRPHPHCSRRTRDHLTDSECNQVNLSIFPPLIPLLSFFLTFISPKGGPPTLLHLPVPYLKVLHKCSFPHFLPSSSFLLLAFFLLFSSSCSCFTPLACFHLLPSFCFLPLASFHMVLSSYLLPLASSLLYSSSCFLPLAPFLLLPSSCITSLASFLLLPSSSFLPHAFFLLLHSSCFLTIAFFLPSSCFLPFEFFLFLPSSCFLPLASFLLHLYYRFLPLASFLLLPPFWSIPLASILVRNSSYSPPLTPLLLLSSSYSPPHNLFLLLSSSYFFPSAPANMIRVPSSNSYSLLWSSSLFLEGFWSL